RRGWEGGLQRSREGKSRLSENLGREIIRRKLDSNVWGVCGARFPRFRGGLFFLTPTPQPLSPKPIPFSADGRRRVVIEGIVPLVDGGRWGIKRIQGDQVVVEADIFADGHEEVRAMLLLRHEPDERWTQSPLESLGNDRWRGEFTVGELG